MRQRKSDGFKTLRKKKKKDGVACTFLRFNSLSGTGMNLRDGMGRELGGRFRMGNTCTPMADSCECMAKTTTIL